MTKVERLLNKIPKDYTVGRTFFEDANLAWMVCNYYEVLYDYDCYDVIEEHDHINKLPVFYGATITEALEKAVEHFKDKE